MTAPDKIWVNPDDNTDGLCPVETDLDDVGKFFDAIQAVEYTRSDLIAARPAPQPAADTRVVTDAERDVIAERQRQRNVEGWTPEHDDEHDTGALAMAASCYATVAAWSDHSRMNEGIMGTPPFWPFEWQWWKPTDRRRDAVKACALLIAEIERLDRAIIGGQDRG